MRTPDGTTRLAEEAYAADYAEAGSDQMVFPGWKSYLPRSIQSKIEKQVKKSRGAKTEEEVFQAIAKGDKKLKPLLALLGVDLADVSFEEQLKVIEEYKDKVLIRLEDRFDKEKKPILRDKKNWEASYTKNLHHHQEFVDSYEGLQAKLRGLEENYLNFQQKIAQIDASFLRTRDPEHPGYAHSVEQGNGLAEYTLLHQAATRKLASEKEEYDLSRQGIARVNASNESKQREFADKLGTIEAVQSEETLKINDCYDNNVDRLKAAYAEQVYELEDKRNKFVAPNPAKNARKKRAKQLDREIESRKIAYKKLFRVDYFPPNPDLDDNVIEITPGQKAVKKTAGGFRKAVTRLMAGAAALTVVSGAGVAADQVVLNGKYSTPLINGAFDSLENFQESRKSRAERQTFYNSDLFLSELEQANRFNDTEVIMRSVSRAVAVDAYDQLNVFLFQKLSPQSLLALLKNDDWAEIIAKKDNADFVDNLVVGLSQNEAFLNLDPSLVQVPPHLQEIFYLSQIQARQNLESLYTFTPGIDAAGQTVQAALSDKLELLNVGALANIEKSNAVLLNIFTNRATPLEGLEALYPTLAQYRALNEAFKADFPNRETVFAGEMPISDEIIAGIVTKWADEEHAGYSIPVGLNLTLPLLFCSGDSIAQTSPPGNRRHPVSGRNRWHNGYDISCLGWVDGEKVDLSNISVVAAFGGEVTFAGWKSGYGNVVIIKGKNNAEYGEEYYAHLDSFAEGIEVGQQIRAGQALGDMGNTGTGTGKHLHLEIRAPRTASLLVKPGSAFSLRQIAKEGKYRVESSRVLSMPGLVGDDVQELHKYLLAKRKENPNLRPVEALVTIGLIGNRGFTGNSMEAAADQVVEHLSTDGLDDFGDYYKHLRELHDLPAITGRQLELIVADAQRQARTNNWLYSPE